MLSTGRNIKQKNDPLQSIDINRLFKGVSSPKKEIKDFIDQLRILKAIDPKSYNKQKTNLPYIVPSLFSPNFRKTENFKSSEHLILDLDHISEYNYEINELKTKLSADENIELMFISPSGDGLKIFFRLSELCFDYHKYSLFYQSFAKKFLQKHSLDSIIDFSTSDVTRACFVSYDANSFINTSPEPIVIDTYVDYNDIFEVKKLENEIKTIKFENTKKTEKEDINKDVFIEIKKKLNPNLKLKHERQKHIFVPEKLDEIIDEAKNYVEGFELVIDEIRNIHYGKKFIFSHKQHTAEINIFYGKRGFSVVRSPKSGTNLELMELGVSVFSEFLAKYQKLN